MGFLDRFRGRSRPRLTGVSTPFAGLSWDWTSSERETIRRLLIYMEGRRVLWTGHIPTYPSRVVASVQELRTELTSAMQQLPERSEALRVLRAMRDSCIAYLNATEMDDQQLDANSYLGEVEALQVDEEAWDDPRERVRMILAARAMNNLREQAYVTVDALTSGYQLNVEGPLAEELRRRHADT